MSLTHRDVASPSLVTVVARDPPFGMPRTMGVRLVTDIQNRLFWCQRRHWPGFDC